MRFSGNAQRVIPSKKTEECSALPDVVVATPAPTSITSGASGGPTGTGGSAGHGSTVMTSTSGTNLLLPIRVLLKALLIMFASICRLHYLV
jgi:hypothetical protein